MKKIYKITLVTIGMCFTAHSLFAQPEIFMNERKKLQENKQRVQKKDPSIMTAYKLLLKNADKALLEGPYTVMSKKNDPPSGDKHDYMSLAPYFWPDPAKPNGLPYMRKDGQTNPEVKDYSDKEYMPKIAALTHTLAMAYYFSGEDKYAKHAAELLKVWFLNKDTRMNPNLNYAQAIKGNNDGRGAGLIDSRHFMNVVDAVGMIKTSAYWSKDDQKNMKQWFSEFLNWMQTSKNGIDEMNAKNNHGVFYDAQRLSLALFIDSTDLAGRIIKNACTRLDSQEDSEGKFPLELERTISLHYSVFVMNAFFYIATMAESTGFDMWNYTSPKGRSLKKALDYHLPYITGKEKWKGTQIKEFETESAFPLLLSAYNNLNCQSCKASVKEIAGDKSERLYYWMLY